MISVCIPVYNLDVRELVNSLWEQSSDIRAEIILIDDASEDRFREKNRTLKKDGISYYQLNQNAGRAKIRNLFIKYAKYRNLLFLDCDSLILSDRFLSTYASQLDRNKELIICGGRIYSDQKPERSRMLHWKYGIVKESKPVAARMIDSNRSFMTNNFLISAKLLADFPFDEQLSSYGHEDSLFGFRLWRSGHRVIHIDNPVLHDELETNSEYLRKTRDAIQNLVFIKNSLENDPEFISSVTLLTAAGRIRKSGLTGIFRTLSYISTPISGFLLRSGLNSLKLLDIYKLGLFFQLDN